MNAHASPLLPALEADSSLAAVLAALAPHDEKVLVIEYGGRTIGAGYHFTEVKAGSFVTLDCGGNTDAWQETILQVEDLAAADGQSFMKVGKFRDIIGQVDKKVRLSVDARLTIEVSAPAMAMQVFDVVVVVIGDETATLQLGARPAICKPRHRAAQAESSASGCCAPSSAKGSGACCG